MIYFLGFLALLAAATRAQDSDPGCFSQGECQRSLFLDSLASEDPQSCLEACRDLEGGGCQFFTHYGDLGSCVLFASCVEFGVNGCDDCVSGRADCPDLVCGAAGDFLQFNRS